MSVPNGVFTDSYHEKDARWTAVDEYTLAHLHPPTKPNHAALDAALAHSRASGLPDIATYPVLGKLLALQCRAGQVTHALEVGTLGGYTDIWLATENPGLKVTTVEVSEEHARVARENLKRAGVESRVEIIVGDAMEVLPRLVEEIRQGKREPIGLTYIDADKENNWRYFDFAIKMSRPGASIYVDNVVRRGEIILKDWQEDESVIGVRELIENVGKDDRVDGIVQQCVAQKSYDGYLFAVVK